MMSLSSVTPGMWWMTYLRPATSISPSTWPMGWMNGLRRTFNVQVLVVHGHGIEAQPDRPVPSTVVSRQGCITSHGSNQ
jgi:hypothetical protein